MCVNVRAPGMGLQHMSAGVEGCAIEGSRVHTGRGVQQQRAPNERKSQRGKEVVAPCRILYALLATLAAFQGCLPAAALTYSGVPRPAPFERREERRRLALITIFGGLQENVKERGIRVVQCIAEEAVMWCAAALARRDRACRAVPWCPALARRWAQLPPPPASRLP